jgi:hypothetical protein
MSANWMLSFISTVFTTSSTILDDVVMGGMVLETNIASVYSLQSMKDQDRLHTGFLTATISSSERVSSIQQRLGGDTAKWQYNW